MRAEIIPFEPDTGNAGVGNLRTSYYISQNKRGALMERAEIIPSSPDAGNADEGRYGKQQGELTPVFWMLT